MSRVTRPIKLSQFRAQQARTTSGPVPTGEGDYAWTADHLVDDPREPILTPTGVLDSRGQHLIRVRMPIKVPMGFHIPNRSNEPDEVEYIVPEDQLSVSDSGMGVEHLSPEEADEEDEAARKLVVTQEDGEVYAKLSDVVAMLQSQGLNVINDLDQADGEEDETPV